MRATKEIKNPWCFHMSLLKQNTTRKGQVDKIMSRLEFENDDNGKVYKIEAICNSAVYANANKSKCYLHDLYHLVL